MNWKLKKIYPSNRATMKIAITGHMDIERCHGIKQENNHKYNASAFLRTYNEIEFYLKRFCLDNNITFSELELISGMARGVDEVFAHIAMNNNLKLILSIPKSVEFHQHKVVKDTPNIKIQAIDYNTILTYPNIKIVEVNDNLNKGGYGYFLARNQSMVDLSDFVLSYKRYESTGTMDCINRAIQQNKYYGNI